MHESAHKAELLANAFNGKNVLPELSENKYTELPRSEHSQNLRNVWSESSAGKVWLPSMIAAELAPTFYLRRS